MSALVRRSEWVDPKVPFPVSSPPRLDRIEFIAIHYPGVPKGALNLFNPVQVMRNTHAFYMGKKPKGFAFGYSFASFPTGRFEGRGFDYANAANLKTNPISLSINIMVNGDDEATESQVGHTRDIVADIWDELGRKVPLIAHGDTEGAATSCPGAGIRRQLRAGLFLPVSKPSPPVEKPADKPDPIIPSPVQEDEDMPKYLQLVAPGKPEAIVAVDGAGVTFIPIPTADDATTLGQAFGAVYTKVSGAQYDEFHKASVSRDLA